MKNVKLESPTARHCALALRFNRNLYLIVELMYLLSMIAGVSC